MVARALDVRHVSVSRQSETWVRGVHGLFPGVEFARAPRPPFNASAHGYQIGPAQLWRINSPAQVLHINSGAINGIDESISVIVQLGGTPFIRGGGAIRHIAPGMLFFADVRCPIETESATQSAELILHLPRRLVLDRHPYLQGMNDEIDQQDPGVILLKAALLATMKTAPRLSVPQGNIALGSILQLISAPQLPSAQRNLNSWRVRRALADIEIGFRDPEVTAETVALNQRISRRRLDAIVIQETSKSLTAHIWERRLLQAAEDLLDHRKAHQQIAEIAFALGFGQAAHFCRAFKRRFRSTPTDWRRQTEPCLDMSAPRTLEITRRA